MYNKFMYMLMCVFKYIYTEKNKLGKISEKIISELGNYR